MINNLVKKISAAAVISTICVSASTFAEVAKPGTYQIDPAHTNAQFSINHLGISNLIGRFTEITGKIQFSPRGNSSVILTILTESVDTNHEKRDKHLRSPDFFNARQYPKITFVSNKVTYSDTGEPIRIEGDLSLHGKVNSVTWDVTPVGAGTDPWGNYRAGYDATTTILRSKFGMNYMSEGIGDSVQLTLNIEAIKK